MKPALGSLSLALAKAAKARRHGEALGGTGVDKVTPKIAALLELFIKKTLGRN